MKIINVTEKQTIDDSKIRIIYQDNDGDCEEQILADVTDYEFSILDYEGCRISVYYVDIDNLITALLVLKEEKEKFDNGKE